MLALRCSAPCTADQQRSGGAMRSCKGLVAMVESTDIVPSPHLPCACLASKAAASGAAASPENLSWTNRLGGISPNSQLRHRCIGSPLTSNQERRARQLFPTSTFPCCSRISSHCPSALTPPRQVVKSSKPDNFTPTIIKQTDDYLYAEFQASRRWASCLLGWVESPPNRNGTCDANPRETALLSSSPLQDVFPKLHCLVWLPFLVRADSSGATHPARRQSFAILLLVARRAACSRLPSGSSTTWSSSSPPTSPALWSTGEEVEGRSGRSPTVSCKRKPSNGGMGVGATSRLRGAVCGVHVAREAGRGRCARQAQQSA